MLATYKRLYFYRMSATDIKSFIAIAALLAVTSPTSHARSCHFAMQSHISLGSSRAVFNRMSTTGGVREFCVDQDGEINRKRMRLQEAFVMTSSYFHAAVLDSSDL